jgi:hypothetical protein
LETGYVSTGFGQVEEPIFAINYVQFQMPAKLVDMAVSNNILVVALDTYRLLRIDLDNPLEVEGKIYIYMYIYIYSLRVTRG